jgi:hypothetical protein
MKHLVKIICGVLLFIALGFGGYYWWQAHAEARRQKAIALLPMKVEVVKTPLQNNFLVPPEGFPQDIPIESGHLVASNLTTFSQGNAKQGSITFISSETSETKHALYLAYMKKAGYTVSETQNGETLSLIGTKTDANLNIVISPGVKGTVVQIAHLFFGH